MFELNKGNNHLHYVLLSSTHTCSSALMSQPANSHFVSMIASFTYELLICLSPHFLSRLILRCGSQVCWISQMTWYERQDHTLHVYHREIVKSFSLHVHHFVLQADAHTDRKNINRKMWMNSLCCHHHYITFSPLTCWKSHKCTRCQLFHVYFFQD